MGWVRRHLRALIATAATLAIVVPLGWLWWVSLVPDTYNVMDMGVVDLGGGPDMDHGMHGGQDVSTLTGPTDGEPAVAVTVTARKESIELVDGPTVDGYTLNGTSPGPEIRATQGDLVEVTLVNESVPDGTTLHWHGVDVPNAEDGVAGVTQDAVDAGEEHVYRFVVEDVGTYWFHSHQVSHEQVRGGLFGTLVVEPREGVGTDVDVVAAVHTYDGNRTVNGEVGASWQQAEPGSVARVRVVNTDNGPMRTWVAGAPYQVVAVDGYDLNEPTDITDTSVLVTAGGLYLIDDEQARVGVRGECLGEAALPEGRGEIVDQLCGGDEVGVEAILDGAIGDRHGEMRFAAPGFPVEDQRAALGDEVGREGRA